MVTYTVKHDGNFKRWYLNGKLHREDGLKTWWLNGKCYPSRRTSL